MHGVISVNGKFGSIPNYPDEGCKFDISQFFQCRISRTITEPLKSVDCFSCEQSLVEPFFRQVLEAEFY